MSAIQEQSNTSHPVRRAKSVRNWRKVIQDIHKMRHWKSVKNPDHFKNNNTRHPQIEEKTQQKKSDRF